MLVDDLDYDLPPELLAVTPALPRDAARLLVVHRENGLIEHLQVRDLAKREDLIGPGDLMVFNQSKVLPAFLKGMRVATGGQVTGLMLHASDDQHWRVLLESRGKLQAGESIALCDANGDQAATLILRERLDAGAWEVTVNSTLSTTGLLNKVGQPPLPPYIRKARKLLGLPPVGPTDTQRYNTVYAQADGSVAAPTAGLHFTETLLADLAKRGVEQAFVTLHVGMGTFAPIRVKEVKDHPIHAEPIRVSQATLKKLRQTRKRGGKIIPVGTTTVRALESLPADWEQETGDIQMNTRLFIHPQATDFQFRFTDALMTNFHLPHSTLLAMVASLPDVGLTRLKSWYAQAISERYRFYSYGDAMLVI